MKIPVFSCILALLLLAATWGETLGAQKEPQARIINTVATPEPDGLAVSILFTIFDQNGYPIPREDIKVEPQAQLQLLTSSSSPAPAAVEEAATPLKIALVLDASGSMGPYMSEVKAAAIRFVDAAPAKAEFAVFRFADDVLPLQGFTRKDKIELVHNAIQSISPAQANTGDTCVYKAGFAALEALNATAAQNSEERRAVVLFTDGKDRENGGRNCGDIQEANVVSEANLSGPIPIQIHTIGLCKDTSCSNVEVDKLKRLSDATYAFTKSGRADELDDVFGTILSGLNSQWIARATVKAVKGENRATLSFKAVIRGLDTPFNLTPPPFNSEQDYTAPPPMVRLIREFDTGKNVYNLTLHVTNSESIGEITVDAWDEAGGSLVSTKSILRDIKPLMSLAQNTDGFRAGARYCSRVSATTKNGVAIKNEKREEILDQVCGVYQPKVEDPPTVKIISREFDQDNNVYTLTLHVTRPEEIAWISVDALDEAGNSLVARGPILRDIRPETSLTQKTDGFKAGARYCSQISAAHKSGLAIKADNGGEVLDQACGVYQPRVEAPPTFSIKSADINWDSSTLDIQLDSVQPPAGKNLVYHGHLNEGSRLVRNIDRAFLLSGLIQVSLPAEELERIQQAAGKMEYTIVLTVQEEGAELRSTQTYNATPTLRAELSLGEHVSRALREPAILSSILIIVLIVVALVVFMTFRSKSTVLAPPPAHNPPTVIRPEHLVPPLGPGNQGRPPRSKEVGDQPTIVDSGPDATLLGAQPHVRIRVVRTTNPEEVRERVVWRFPCTIGRSMNSGFPIMGDANLSRSHAEINLEAGKLVVRDCNSVNRTFIGDTVLPTGGSVELGRHNIIRLGRNTELEIVTHGDDAATILSAPVGTVP